MEVGHLLQMQEIVQTFPAKYAYGLLILLVFVTIKSLDCLATQ